MNLYYLDNDEEVLLFIAITWAVVVVTLVVDGVVNYREMILLAWDRHRHREDSVVSVLVAGCGSLTLWPPRRWSLVLGEFLGQVKDPPARYWSFAFAFCISLLSMKYWSQQHMYEHEKSIIGIICASFFGPSSNNVVPSSFSWLLQSLAATQRS